MPRAVIIGAGALGLGFLAERMAGSYDLCLADLPSRQPFLRRLAEAQGFGLNLCWPDRMEVRDVRGAFQVADVSDRTGPLEAALREADLVLTAVGGRALPEVMRVIAPILTARTRRCWLLFCENGRNIAATFGKDLGPLVDPVDTVMSRMCRFADPGEERYAPAWPDRAEKLVVESYGRIPLDRALCGEGPFAPVFDLVDSADFRMWEDIKLFMHNGLHACVAYHAWLEGTTRFPAVSRSIWSEARCVMQEELVPAIAFHHPAARPGDLEEYGRELLQRFASPCLNDSIERGVRGAAEKLAPGERLLGGRDYILEAGIEPRGYATTIDAARRVVEETRHALPA